MDVNKYKQEQEIQKAADLKAKLAMVEVRKKPTHGRAPRKIGEMVCDTGIKVGYRMQTANFVLRLDAQEGDFIAEYGDVWYVSKSRDALKAKMDEVARAKLDLEWSRYLRIEYRAEVPYNSNWHNTTTLDIDDARHKGTAVIGISLKWEVIEYSNAFELPGQGKRHMQRDVDEKGKPLEVESTVDELPDGIVPYTEEREDTLRRLRAALTAVDAQMVNLFRGTPHHVGRALDELGGDVQLVLESGGEKPTKSKR